MRLWILGEHWGLGYVQEWAISPKTLRAPGFQEIIDGFRLGLRFLSYFHSRKAPESHVSSHKFNIHRLWFILWVAKSPMALMRSSLAGLMICVLVEESGLSGPTNRAIFTTGKKGPTAGNSRWTTKRNMMTIHSFWENIIPRIWTSLIYLRDRHWIPLES